MTTGSFWLRAAQAYLSRNLDTSLVSGKTLENIKAIAHELEQESRQSTNPTESKCPPTCWFAVELATRTAGFCRSVALCCQGRI